jgi:hypothetical protein
MPAQNRERKPGIHQVELVRDCLASPYNFRNTFNRYVQRQIAAGMQSYPDRPRRTETFDWGAEDAAEGSSKTDTVVAELIRKKIGPAAKEFAEYFKGGSQTKLIKLMSQIDTTGNCKVEYAEFRTWVHCHHPSLCRC